MKKSISTLKEVHKGKLILRKLNPEADVEQLLRLLSDDQVLRFIRRQKVEEVSDAHRFIEKMNGGMEQDEWGFWAICKENEPLLLGTICLWGFSPDRKKAEIGYELLPEHQGNGIMTEAVSMIVTIGFKFLKLTEIRAFTDVRNEKSQRLLEKNEFERLKQIEEEGQWMFVYAIKKDGKKEKKYISSKSDDSPLVGASLDASEQEEPS